ncbi:MAG TPA: hypothetical protein VMW10_02940 [Alphaproteobacteria bacterium]|nr:hypothetical protein [Alphaproteobacteria bacterium]
MFYKVLPVLGGIFMFSPILEASNSVENLETRKLQDIEEASREDPRRLREFNDLGVVFDDPEMGSTPYQQDNKTYK